MSSKLLVVLFLGFFGGTVWIWTHFDETSARSEVQGEQITLVNSVVEQKTAEPEYVTTAYTVEVGDVFTAAMEALDIPYSTALEIVDVATDVFDFTRIRDGKTFVLYRKGGVAQKLLYEPDTERTIVVVLTPTIKVVEETIIYEVTETVADATIESSLFVAGARAGMPDTLILDIADVFAWTIDFATQVQTGDSVRVLYESRTRDGVAAGHGDILAAEFTNNGRSYLGYKFTDADGKLQYYDEDGNSLIKQFLKAPLAYNRISSGFSYSRFHPTLGKNTPHRAIDYAAPAGTPILSVGDGTVVFAGWGGGYGNFVKIRHNSTYQTHYAHLSYFAKGLSVGDVVEQGQVIGFVGSTGYSTGPHLHYEIQKNGTLVNPLNIELPAGDPVPEALRASFEARKAVLHQQLFTQ
jgi:murein DD-endopeptidase MepM/ murein hydrolase activator NlpD